jgi:hypothetical protein
LTRRNVVLLVVILAALTVWYLRPSSDPTPTPTPSPTPVGKCPADPLMGVYHPSRLIVQRKCEEVTGVVTSVRHEEDGDYHVNVMPDQPGLTNAENNEWEGGALVTEIMPGQRFRIPDVGDRVDVLGTWVLDTNHGWLEIHPIFCINGRCSLPVVPPTYG